MTADGTDGTKSFAWQHRSCEANRLSDDPHLVDVESESTAAEAGDDRRDLIRGSLSTLQSSGRSERSSVVSVTRATPHVSLRTAEAAARSFLSASNSTTGFIRQTCKKLFDRLVTISHSTGGLWKFGLDVVIAGLALVALLPVFLIVALLVKWSSAGPVFYAHQRVGHGGRLFNCLKFRTMVVNGDEVLRLHFVRNPAAQREWEATQKLEDDPRVTPLGHILRKTSLDELPQLLNVVQGDMSCVGPRPVVQNELRRYGVHGRHYLKSRPGLTGLWQVSGRSATQYRQRVILDTKYVRDWSLMGDIELLFRTVPAVFRFSEAK